MVTSKNITATEGRLTSNFDKFVRHSINNSGIDIMNFFFLVL